jgi:DNA repair protein RadC
MRELICDLPFDDRPRERLFRHGASTLSDSELIALLLGSGMPGKNALQLARELLASGLRDIATRDPDQLAKTVGVGQAKASRIIAAFEVARRAAEPDYAPDPPTIDVSSYAPQLVARYGRHRQERLGAAILDSRFRLIRERDLFVGTVTHAAVSTRELIAIALEENGVNLLAFHNHPSGDTTPSLDDIQFTRKLRDAMTSIDVKLIDHLIIGKHSYLSMKEKGLC